MTPAEALRAIEDALGDLGFRLSAEASDYLLLEIGRHEQTETRHLERLRGLPEDFAHALLVKTTHRLASEFLNPGRLRPVRNVSLDELREALGALCPGLFPIC